VFTKDDAGEASYAIETTLAIVQAVNHVLFTFENPHVVDRITSF
jgi:hypothetical protein